LERQGSVLLRESVDPRWKQLQHRSWDCISCGQTHVGLFDLGCARPDFWRDSEQPLSNSAISGSTHCLTEDFCIVDNEHHFVRCLLRLPLVGSPGEYFGFGVWSTLAPKNFDKYVSTFDSGDQDGLGPWFGWFSNRLKGYPDTLNLKCHVHPQPGRQRPWLELEATEHPLARESLRGITYERLLEIYAACGHAVGQPL
jgi:hypothetical protein